MMKPLNPTKKALTSPKLANPILLDPRNRQALTPRHHLIMISRSSLKKLSVIFIVSGRPTTETLRQSGDMRCRTAVDSARVGDVSGTAVHASDVQVSHSG